MLVQSKSGTEIRTARKTAIPTQTLAADALGMSVATYNSRELHQENFTIKELKMLYSMLGDDGKDTIAEYVQRTFPAKRGKR